MADAALPLQPLPQRGDLSHAGEGEFLEGDEVVGGEGLGHRSNSLSGG